MPPPVKPMSRFGALASKMDDEDLRTLVADAIRVVGAGLDTLRADRRRAVHDAVILGGRIELRVAICTETPVVSLYLCSLGGTEEELGHCRLSSESGASPTV